MEPWKILSRQTLIHDPWLRLHADRCELPGGSVLDPFYVMEEREWVHVIARRDDGQVLLVRQYRHGAQIISSELPGGVADDGESPLDTARRELLEETGYEADNWRHAISLHANPGRQTNRIHAFIATGLRHTAAQRLDASEAIECFFATHEEIMRLIRSGDFAPSMQVACYLAARELA